MGNLILEFKCISQKKLNVQYYIDSKFYKINVSKKPFK